MLNPESRPEANTAGTGAGAKDEQLEHRRVRSDGAHLTTEQGVRVDHTDDSLSAGERGPTLLEDFHAREKITHFDHERIPERVVHARGAGAYGYFQPYDDWLAEYTVASFLTDPAVRTPTFTRFSTVAGSRGSADTVRDVRGFATKFYTDHGNYDLVGNNMPVFFIQDGIKFPDFVHAVKPEPDREIPQAQSAHDTFWDFVSLQPETLHMVMWLMSDRALPRSYRMMQGFGVHTFRLVNASGQGTFVKFHWTPMLGTHSMVWDEAQKIQGKDPDFNRRDLWDAIAAGAFPEYELGVQLVPESDEFAFDFDLLDPTKIIPEEDVPVRPVGRLTLNRNPDNFFAETEQVAFHTANMVPGIDFTNDPLLQARNFSYLDTQLIRLGGPNFTHLPVNRPVVEVTNNQRDGFGQSRVHVGRSSYEKNSVGSGCPVVGGEFGDVFAHYQEKVEGSVVRRRAESFRDHYSQAALFWNSMSDVERTHIVAAFRFEVGKVEDAGIRTRVLAELTRVDGELAERVAHGLGRSATPAAPASEHGKASPALSQLNTTFGTCATRVVAVLMADGVGAADVHQLRDELTQRDVIVEFLAPVDGAVRSDQGEQVAVDRAVNTVASVLYDAVIVPGGDACAAALSGDGYCVHFVTEAYKHHKPVGGFGTGTAELLQRCGVRYGSRPEAPTTMAVDDGVLATDRTGEQAAVEFVEQFAAQLARHRIWERRTDAVPA
ncbi:catalase [Haloactinopolyspora alba]|uniref:Catalase n=1 Tax=Haloactinopolyspora alba TaxID=648780 RepID=A0A2P8EC86_9ACTN|nr:catalase [Haloactinopolyspora alba]PSL07060.1 catalase [Haloactinopolyspora alba]